MTSKYDAVDDAKLNTKLWVEQLIGRTECKF